MITYRRLSIIVLLLINGTIFSNSLYRTAHNEVHVYCGNNEKMFEAIEPALHDFGISFKKVDRLDKNSKNLHVILDAFYVPFEYFPQDFIMFQTLDLDEVPLTQSYIDKMKKAVAIWDPSWKNISKYCLVCENYYHVQQDTLDPLLLPCMLPAQALADYKELLRYSNSKDTDISSHLPVLFAHCTLKQPKLVIETGVRSGESTKAFKKALELCCSSLIGVDIDKKSADVYAKLNIKNAEFKIMDDVQFPAWWQSSDYKEKKADIIFIDTSHYYDHTMQELEGFLPLLADNGMLMFHDTNMCPMLKNTYKRINNTWGIGWDNKKGVVRAIKDFFGISFDESKYTLMNFSAKGSDWMLLHYPYCNGFTVIERIN